MKKIRVSRSCLFLAETCALAAALSCALPSANAHEFRTYVVDTVVPIKETFKKPIKKPGEETPTRPYLKAEAPKGGGPNVVVFSGAGGGRQALKENLAAKIRQAAKEKIVVATQYKKIAALMQPVSTRTPYSTSIYTNQYDGFADFPRYGIVRGDLNVIAGIYYHH